MSTAYEAADDMQSPRGAEIELDSNCLAEHWAEAEILRWWASRSRLGQDDARNLLKSAHRANMAFCLFSVQAGRVSVLDGVGSRVGQDAETERFLAVRERAYQQFLAKAVRERCPEVSTVIGMGLGDRGLQGNEGPPNFAFQKTSRSTTFLLPDIDLIIGNFFESQQYDDKYSYSDKLNSAIFCGATTGALYTTQVVQNLGTPRLEAAMKFKDHPFVHFYLPKLVQYDSEETRVALLNLGLGDGRRFSWEDQFRHKFIISMDGNGATCSRVALALRSNSVLLKYDSKEELYYFKGMTPWVHYIPIAAHDEIEEIVLAERGRPGIFEAIARKGREFAEGCLNEHAALCYTAALVKKYSQIFPSLPLLNQELQDKYASRQIAQFTEADQSEIIVTAHLADVGDVAAPIGSAVGRQGSQKAIQGISIEDRRGRSLPIEYRIVLPNGSLSSWVRSPFYCGTKGRGLPAFGFAIRSVPSEVPNPQLTYSATFVDGSSVGPISQGKPCMSASLSPLEWMKIEVVGPSPAGNVDPGPP